MALQRWGLGEHLVVRRGEGMDKRAMDSRLFVTTVRRRVTGAVNVGNSNQTQQKGFVQRKSRQQLRWLRRINQRTLLLQLMVRPVHLRANINGFWIVAVVLTLRVCRTVLPLTNEFPTANTGFVLPTMQRSMRSVETMSLSWYVMMESNARWSYS